MSIPALLKEFEGFGTYQILNHTLESDSYGSGIIDVWSAGPTFEATVTLDDSVTMRLAESQGVHGAYRVATSRNIRLPWHTVFWNTETRKTYRVTSKDENASPAKAGMDSRYVSAEDYEIVSAKDISE